MMKFLCFDLDVNECDDNNGGCEQICTNLDDGSFQCSCNSGFVLASDNMNCDGRFHQLNLLAICC